MDHLGMFLLDNNDWPRDSYLATDNSTANATAKRKDAIGFDSLESRSRLSLT